MSKSDEDPMEYLNQVRAKMSTLKDNQEAGEEAIVAASKAKESMERIENMLSSTENEDSGRSTSNQPPPGLTPEEEQQWWSDRIAFLSKPVSESYSDPAGSKQCQRKDVASKKGSDEDDEKYSYKNHRK